MSKVNRAHESKGRFGKDRALSNRHRRVELILFYALKDRGPASEQVTTSK